MDAVVEIEYLMTVTARRDYHSDQTVSVADLTKVRGLVEAEIAAVVVAVAARIHTP